MVVLHTDAATALLGDPSTTAERGVVEPHQSSYTYSWNWPCGCRGDVIAGTLIELQRCPAHDVHDQN